MLLSHARKLTIYDIMSQLMVKETLADQDIGIDELGLLRTGI